MDVTDLHTALHDAERLRAHFEAIFTDTDMPMATLDEHGAFLDVNVPMLTLIGVSGAALSAETFVALSTRGP